MGSLSHLPLIWSAGSDLPLAVAASSVTAPTAMSLSLSTLTTPDVTPVVADTPLSGTGSALLCNLLPGANLGRDPASIYVREGLLPVPVKLAEKIVR